MILPFVEPLERRRLLTALPTFDHVVIVVEENHSYDDVIGYSAAPYINSLAQQGALFTQAFAVVHPSQPNYLALFSGDTQGVTGDGVHPKFSGPDLYSDLKAAGKTFAGYSQSMPSNGFDGAISGDYARKHNPVTQFTDVPETVNKVFNTKNFPTAASTNYSFLPNVSLVVPDLANDMHNGTRATADAWLANNLGAYAKWATTHNSLLIVTWDEDDRVTAANRIATIIYGAHVTPGQYAERIDHYTVLRTVEDIFGATAHAGASAAAGTIADIWDAASTAAPAAPTSLSAIDISSSEAQVTWTSNGEIDGVQTLDVATDANFNNKIQSITLPANQTKFVVEGLTAGNTYYFRVRAKNSIGSSSHSNTGSASLILDAPDTPTNLNASPETASSVQVTWEDNSPDESGYIVDWATDANFTTDKGSTTVPADSRSAIVTGLTQFTTYYFQVRGTNAAGDSPESNADTASPTNVVKIDNQDTGGVGGGVGGRVGGSGVWWRSTAVDGFYKGDYFENGNSGQGAKNIRFTPTLPEAGTYRVLLRWSADANRPKSVPVDITSVAGTDTVRVNERINGGQFNDLGRFNYDPATGPMFVTIRTGGAGGYVVADAVEFEELPFDASQSTPHHSTRKHPVKFKNNLQIKEIPAAVKQIPPVSDQPRPTHKRVKPSSSSAAGEILG